MECILVFLINLGQKTKGKLFMLIFFLKERKQTVLNNQ